MRILIFFTVVALFLGGCVANNAPAQKPAGISKDKEKRAEDYFPHRKDLLIIPEVVKKSAPFPRMPWRLGTEIPQPPPDNVSAGDYRLQFAHIVEADGTVSEVVVVLSSGVKTLDDMYVEVIKKRRYQPAAFEGKNYPAALLETIDHKVSRF
jgi:hypothetical protein